MFMSAVICIYMAVCRPICMHLLACAWLCAYIMLSETRPNTQPYVAPSRPKIVMDRRVDRRADQWVEGRADGEKTDRQMDRHTL